jgi:hypothetical protein
MNILNRILKGGLGDSDTSDNNDSDASLTLDQSKAKVEELRRSISGLKKRHERSIQLKAATCNTSRSIKKLQAEVGRLKRRYPSITGVSQDTYRA